MKYLLTAILCVLTGTASAQIIKVEETKNYDVQSLAKLKIAVQLLDSILATDAFKQNVLNASFIGTNGRSNQEIYDHLMSGNSKYDNSGDRTINLYLAAYNKYAGGGELGKTVGKVTSTHRCFILRNDVRCLARHLIHEYMHVQGYHHYKSQKPKSKTVPYVIGDMVRTMLAGPFCSAIKDNCSL